jgi:cysteine desulfurase / selenocysteine lyase
MKISLSDIKKYFPTLKQEINGHPLTYLDNAATTFKPLPVIEKMREFNELKVANIHRGIHYLSEICTSEYEKTRDLVQNFINAKSRKEVIFTKGTTESINLVALSYGNAFIKQGDEILISELEHHSNIVPWQMLCERTGATLKVLPINARGEWEMQKLPELLSQKTKLVCVNYISNSLGTINPIKDIISAAKAVGAKVLIDGAQAIAHKKVDVQELGCDFFAFSMHKLYGPTGVGILWGREEILNSMPPVFGGGDMIDQVSFEKTTYNDLPYKFEAGTPNITNIIASGAAVEFMQKLDWHEILEHESSLLKYATEQLSSIKQLKLIGTAQNKSNVASFVIDQVHAQDIATFISHYGVAIRTGHHCTQPVMKKMGVAATARASMTIYNDKQDIDRLVKTLNKLIELYF